MYKYPIFLIVALFANLTLNGQEDFIAIDYLVTQANYSDYLQQSRHSTLLADPSQEDIGFIASPTGNGVGLGLTFAKFVNQYIAIFSRVKYMQRDEEATCFCHVCDKVSKPEVLVEVRSASMGLGMLANLPLSKRMSASVSSDFGIASSFNEHRLSYPTFSITTGAKYSLSSIWAGGFSMGYQRLFGNYSRAEKLFTFSLERQLQAKSRS